MFQKQAPKLGLQGLPKLATLRLHQPLNPQPLPEPQFELALNFILKLKEQRRQIKPILKLIRPLAIALKQAQNQHELTHVIPNDPYPIHYANSLHRFSKQSSPLQIQGIKKRNQHFVFWIFQIGIFLFQIQMSCYYGYPQTLKFSLYL